MVEIGKIEFCVPATEFGGQVPDQNYVGISTLKKHSQGSWAPVDIKGEIVVSVRVTVTKLYPYLSLRYHLRNLPLHPTTSVSVPLQGLRK